MKFEYYTNEIDEVSSLIKEIYNIDINKENFKLQNNQNLLLLKELNTVVGLVLITLKNNPFKNKKSYYLDYLCVREKYQGKSFGKMIFEKVITIAKENNINYIELTSKKERIRARKIYLEHGMTIKDTDYFILEL